MRHEAESLVYKAKEHPSLYKYHQPLIKQEIVVLKQFFVSYLPAGFVPQSVMNFCAGIANEEPVLRELFGRD